VNKLNRRDFLRLTAAAATGAVMAACAPATPVVIEREVIKEVPVEKPVVVEKEVPKEVIKEVAVEKVVKETVVVEKEVVKEVPVKPAGPIKLTVATDWNSGPRKEMYDQLTVRFEEMHPDVKVEVWHMGSGGTSGPGGMADIVRAQELTGSAADVLQGMPAGSMDFAKDYLLDITDLATELGWKMEDWYFSPAQSYSPDGKLRVLPFNVSVSGWMYNKTMFEEEGIDEPTDDWTFNDMVEVAKKFTNPEKGQYGVWAKTGEWYGYGEHMFAAGATMFTKDRLRSGLCDGHAPDIFERWIDLIFKDEISPAPGEVSGLLTAGVTNFFATGKVAMMPHGVHSTGGLMRQIGDRFVASVMPTPKDPETGLRCFQQNNDGNGVFVLAAERGTAELAVEYIMEMIGDWGQEFVAREAPCFPCSKKWAHSDLFLEPPPLNKEQVLINRETYEPIPMMWFEHWGEAMRAFRSEKDKAFTGEVPAKEAYFAGCEAVEKVLAEYKGEIEPWQFDFGFPLEGLDRANSKWM